MNSCAGCAPAVVAAYRAEGFQLVLNVCNGSGAGEGGASYLEVSVVELYMDFFLRCAMPCSIGSWLCMHA